MNNTERLYGRIQEFENEIGYKFNNRENVVLALTHSSYANENRSERFQSNERLEFLGDAVLNIAISETIYLNHSDLAEGDMTKVRANIVCEPSLVKCSEKLNIGKYLLLGKGEEVTGGRTRVSILSDAFEPLIGAIYLDGGIEKAKKFIYDQMSLIIINSVRGTLFLDHKTQFQELIQKNNDSKITYEIVGENGPDHNKAFVSQVKVNNKIMGTGEGRSKKEAEQNAARAALEKVKEF